MWQDLTAWLSKNWWAQIVLILIAAYLARRFGQMAIEQIIRRTIRYHAHGDMGEEDAKKRQDTLIGLFSIILRVIIYLVASFTILRYFNIDVTPLLASAGVVGVALGFGAQSLIKDFLSGLFIILENQYRVGDIVTLDGADGRVEQITIRSTVVRDDSGSVHYIPNGSIEHTVNKTMGYARVNLTISVSPDADVDKLAELVNEIGEKMAHDEKWKKKIIEAPHFSNVSNFTPTALEVKISGKVQPSAQWSITGELRKRLLAALNKKDIKATDVGAAGKKK